MKTFKSGSYTADWDDTLKPGDLITAYNSGIYEFVGYKDRGKFSAPVIEFTKRFNSNGKSCKSKNISGCDAAYVRRAEDFLKKEIEKKKNEVSRLETILKSIEKLNEKSL